MSIYHIHCNDVYNMVLYWTILHTYQDPTVSVHIYGTVDPLYHAILHGGGPEQLRELVMITIKVFQT